MNELTKEKLKHFRNKILDLMENMEISLEEGSQILIHMSIFIYFRELSSMNERNTVIQNQINKIANLAIQEARVCLENEEVEE